MSAGDVPGAVIDVVRAWVTAPDVEAAAAALKRGRLSLDAALQPVLVHEVAAITAETMVEVIAMEKGLDVDAELVEVGVPGEDGGQSIELHPKQLERLSAWANDLAPTADALGLDADQLTKRLAAAMDELREVEEAGGVRGESVAKARKLLGDDGGRFENRPELGTSQKAGLAGRLAALQFQRSGSGEEPEG